MHILFPQNESAGEGHVDGYTRTVDRLRNYTMDEKCEKGLDFGIGFIWISPYVDIGYDFKKGKK